MDIVADEIKIAQPKIKVDAGMIDRALHRNYVGNAEIKISNVYVYNWESDFFVLKQNHNVYEFEVKVSRSDFFADFNKREKHETLQSGSYNRTWNKQTTLVNANRPNKFFFCCPTGLIKKEELPSYAGLFYYDPEKKTVKKIKEAPFLHRDKFTLFHSLSRSLNNRIIDERSSNEMFRKNHNALRFFLHDMINDESLSDDAKAFAKKELNNIYYTM